MRKSFTIIVAVLLTAGLFMPWQAIAQVQLQKKMSYQAVIRNSTGGLVQNSLVGIRISILQTTSTGTAVYIETHADSTNANGLVSLEIGGGNPVTGYFNNIDWSAGPYFIQTETDPTGGSSYSITGVSELLYVPYSFNADIASTSNDNRWNSDGANIYNNNSANVGIRNMSPNASLSIGRGDGQDGTAAFFGTTHTTHINYSTDENTYVRGGKDNSNVILNDIPGGKIGFGMSNPSRAIVEQYGTIGSTAAIFGGDGPGISLQSNWPAIGLNHFYDGSNSRSIGAGYGAQIFVDQTIGIGGGAIGFTNFPVRAGAPNGLLLNPITRIYLQNGRIGMGTSDPQADIDIIEDIDQVNVGGTAIGIRFVDNINGTTGRLEYTGGYLRYYYNGSYVAYVNTSGDWVSVSDSTLKKDIHPLKADLLAKLNDVNPVTYHMKKEPIGSVLQYGFISQNIQHVFPELVTESDGIKMLNYQGMIPIAIEAIKELHLDMDAMKKENQLLQERLKKLEEIVSQGQKATIK